MAENAIDRGRIDLIAKLLQERDECRDQRAALRTALRGAVDLIVMLATDHCADEPGVAEVVTEIQAVMAKVEALPGSPPAAPPPPERERGLFDVMERKD